MKIYISGPISGYKDLNKKSFNNAKKYLLKKYDCEIINPLEINSSSDWIECMRNDIKALVDCDMIYMLNNWEKSRGANIEYELSKALNIVIIYEKKM